MKSFIKFLPIIAAVMLATSCSKDDNDNVPETQSGRDGVQTVSTSTIPFTIRVNTGRSLKKVGYAESTKEGEKSWYNITFSNEDVSNQLKMIIKEGDNKIGEATIQSDKATFSGSLTQQPSSNTDLTAVITTGGNSSATYSDKSLQDLLENCAHTFLGTFQYGAAEVTLTDQNAYLAISMSPCCEHDITINATDYTVKDGRIWISVSASEGVTSQGLGTEISKQSTEVSPGTIYTVARQYFTVADGKKVYFSKGNLQYNVGENAQTKWRFAPTQYDKCFDDGNHYSSEEYIKADHEGWTGHEGWIDLFGWGTWLNGNGIEEPYETQTDDATTYKWSGNSAIGEDWYTLTTEEFRYLFSYGNYTNDTRANKYGEGKVARVNGIILFPDVWTYPTDLTSSSTSAANFTTGESAWSNKYTADDWKKMEAAGAVFLPAAGYREGTAVYDVGGDGFYWSSSADDGLDAYRLFFYSDNVDPDFSRKRYYGLSVRIVRAL